MKRLAIIFLVLSSILSWSQINNSNDYVVNTFTSTNGYKLSNPLNAAYDKLGYLWILGNNANQNNFQIENKKLLLQRFDGVNFYDVFLPSLLNNVSLANFVEYDEYFLLILLLNNGDSLFYKINLYTLKVEPFKEFEILKKEGINFKAGPFIINNQKIFLFQKGNVYQLYKSINDTLIFTDSVKVKKPLALHRSTVFRTKAKQVYIFLGYHEIYLLSDNGKFLRSFSLKDASRLGLEKIPKEIYFSFDNQGYTYYRDLEGNLFFKVNNENLIPEKLDVPFPFKGKQVGKFHNTKNQLAGIIKTQFNYQLHVYDVIDDKDPLRFKASYPVNSFISTTENVDKYITVFNDNNVKTFWYNSKLIDSYVLGKSIRFTKELNNNEFLITSDEEGVFRVNTKTKKEEKLHLEYQEKELQLLYPRNIFSSKNNIYFTDRDKIIKTDKKFKVLNVFHHQFKEQAIKIGDTIFRGGLQTDGILKFNLKNQKFDLLKTPYKFSIREFAEKNNCLFAVTKNKGILKYEKGNLKFYLPDNEKPQNLLSIANDKTFGLLVSTKQGKVYTFNALSNTFSLIYRDSFQASIVGMVSDSKGVLWLNTYAGIVSFHKKYKEVHRYTKEDGVFELEGNRYSTTKDSHGNIIMGSYRGLSIFNPNELNKKLTNTKLQLTALSFFDENKQQWNVNTAPDFLRSVKKIELPYHNQRFNVKIAMLNQVNFSDYKLRYRLVKKDKEKEIPWNTTKFGNELIFTNLAPTNYRLEVDLLNSVEEKLGDTLFLDVTSNPIFYQTWWFYLIAFIVVSTILLYFLKQYKDKRDLYTIGKIALNEARIKETMMLEMHHRIKNNLQVVSGLLGLQAFQTNNGELREKLKESQYRIESIARIHNILYSGDDQEFVLVSKYFEKIINLNNLLFKEKVQFVTRISDVKLNMDNVVPLALILNELINNSYKHAFKNVSFPEIEIEFKKTPKEFTLIYKDNGIFNGFSSNTKSLGIKIIKMMSTQLKGKTSMHSNKGFEFELIFLKHIE